MSHQKMGEVRRALRFGLVGAVGFTVDAGVLLLLVHAGLGPLSARLVSFGVAVVATWSLNRWWAFRVDDPATLREFASYLGVQGTGIAVNFFVYATLLLALSASEWRIFAALAVASALAMVVNYLGLRIFVFTGK